MERRKSQKLCESIPIGRCAQTLHSKQILLAKAPMFHNPVGAFRRKADYKNEKDNYVDYLYY